MIDVAEQEQDQPREQKRAALVALVALVAIVALALVGYGAISSADSAPSSGAAAGYALSESVSGGDAARALACTVVDADGANVTLAQISDGEPLVVNLWATWCPYCVAEMGDYQRLYEAYGDRIRFAMVNVCDTSREVSLARDFIAEGGYTFPVFYDADHQAVALLEARAYPTTAIISPGGQVLMNRAGQITYESMDATLAELAGE